MIRLIRCRGGSLALLCCLLAGCTSDERLLRQSEQASERQAEQNRQIAQQNQQLAAATHQLISADAEARLESLALQRALQAEATTIGERRDQLELERRELARARYREPLLATALAHAGLLVACLVPLLLCALLLRGLRREPAEQELADLLTLELVATEPLLLPKPRLTSAANVPRGGDRPSPPPPTIPL